jgi:hypothetical protein
MFIIAVVLHPPVVGPSVSVEVGLEVEALERRHARALIDMK